jgi:hypothetical protein
MFKCTVSFQSDLGKRHHWSLKDASIIIERFGSLPILTIQQVNGKTGHAIPVDKLKRLIAGKDYSFSFRYPVTQSGRPEDTYTSYLLQAISTPKPIHLISESYFAA